MLLKEFSVQSLQVNENPTEWLNNWDIRGQLPAAETRV
jgi:hypothetical protein